MSVKTKTKLTIAAKTALLQDIIAMLAEYVPTLAGATAAYYRSTRQFVVTGPADNRYNANGTYADVLIWLGCVALLKQVALIGAIDETVEIAVRNSLTEGR